MARGSYVVAGVVLANLFSVAGWCLFYRILWKRYGSEVAWWSLCFLVLFPGSVFYQFIYSESLFFLLAMVLWRGIEERRYGGAVLAAFLLPLARGGGLRGSDYLALGSVVAGEKVAGVGLAAAGAQAGVGSVAGEIGGVVVSVVIVVGAGGGLELLFGADVALDGESF